MFALYAYLIVAGGIVLWMYCAEKAGGHLALAHAGEERGNRNGRAAERER